MKRHGEYDELLTLAPIMDFNKFLSRLAVGAGELDMLDGDLAERAGLCYGTVHRIMRRESKNMYVTTLYKLSRAIGVSSDWLMGLRPAHTEREKDFDYKARGLRRIVNIIEGKKERKRRVA